MLIERIWAANEGRNYHYLIACEESGEALAVDPLNARALLERARELRLQIRQVFNTHEHRDHTGGNAAVVAATGAQVLAHAAAAARIGGVTRALTGADVVRVGRSVQLRCLDTPGHTRAHLCLYAAGSDSRAPALFSGDTLFNAGAGNCHSSGRPDLLYETFVTQLARLPEATRVYPGHEYLARNLDFTLDREPDNGEAAALLERWRHQDPASGVVTTLGEEKRINTFFRLQSPTVIARLRDAFPEIGEQPDARTVFLKLRELRNRW